MPCQAEAVVAGVSVVLDCSGALWLPKAKTLVFSDLHFEKGTSYGRKGLFLPPYDTRRTLQMMAAVIARYRPETIISLGDAFHDLDAETRMAEADADQLAGMTRAAAWVWILGNHDPEPPARFAGKCHERIVVGGLDFSHAPCATGNWQVAGHMHPAARVVHEGRSQRRRCFIGDGERLVLPSFGAYTGGLNILDAAYHPFFANGFSVHVLGRERAYGVPLSALRADSQVQIFRG